MGITVCLRFYSFDAFIGRFFPFKKAKILINTRADQQFVDQHIIAGQNGRLHRTGRHFERNKQENFHNNRKCYGQKNKAYPFE